MNLKFTIPQTNNSDKSVFISGQIIFTYCNFFLYQPRYISRDQRELNLSLIYVQGQGHFFLPSNQTFLSSLSNMQNSLTSISLILHSSCTHTCNNLVEQIFSFKSVGFLECTTFHNLVQTNRAIAQCLWLILLWLIWVIHFQFKKNLFTLSWILQSSHPSLLSWKDKKKNRLQGLLRYY